MLARKTISFFFFGIFFFSGISFALPSYRRLWEKKYGYSTSCTLCHSKGGGSQVNPYGSDFQRFGMTAAAFGAIEKRDSDKDGASNIDEITAKANPGDFLSTVQRPTEWLGKIEESMLPTAELKKIFPAVSKFSTLEGTLLEDQIAQIEKDLSKKLTAEDAVPTFYFAVVDQAGKAVRVGVALFSTPNVNPEKLIVGIGVDLAGKIQNVILIKNKLKKGINDRKFLDQFKDKSADSSLQLNTDIQPSSKSLAADSDQVIEAVKKSLLIMRVVFNKNQKTLSKGSGNDYAYFKKACSSFKSCIDQFLGNRP